MDSNDWFSWSPETEERMNFVGGRYTACEVIRQAYRRIQDPEVKLMLRIATTMCKSMATRITKYDGRRWGKDIYPLNPYLNRETEMLVKVDILPPLK